MRVLVVGASGAIGTRLVPQLRRTRPRGDRHLPVARQAPSGCARSAPSRSRSTCSTRAAARQAVLDAEPEAIIHQATALADAGFSRNLDRTFAPTNRLRTEGTDTLLAAAREAGVRRFVAQSFARYRYAREGGPVKTEDDPLDPAPPRTARQTNAAMRHLDEAVTAAGGIALRYGGFYGAANDGLVPAGAQAAVPDHRRRRRRDRRSSTSTTRPRRPCSRSKHDGPGVYNIVDDEPAPVRDWLPVLAERARRQAAPPRAALARAADRGRGPGDDDRGPRRLERQGQARTRLDAPLPELAPGLRRRLRSAGTGQGRRVTPVMTPSPCTPAAGSGSRSPGRGAPAGARARRSR